MHQRLETAQVKSFKLNLGVLPQSEPVFKDVVGTYVPDKASVSTFGLYTCVICSMRLSSFCVMAELCTDEVGHASLLTSH